MRQSTIFSSEIGRLISIILANTKSLGMCCSCLHTVFSIVGSRSPSNTEFSVKGVLSCQYYPPFANIHFSFKVTRQCMQKQPHLAFFVILVQIMAFLTHLVPKNANEVPIWFSDIWAPKRLLPLEKLGCLAQGRPYCCPK